MCYHRLYIFLVCGHSVLSLEPIRHCSASQAKHDQHTHGSEFQPSRPSKRTSTDEIPSADPPDPEECSALSPFKGKQPINAEQCPGPQVHPFQTLRINAMCASCAQRRDMLLAEAETGQKIKFEEWKWKVRYLSPVPEARYNEWGGVGEAMGSWVAGLGEEWKRAGGWMAALKDTGMGRGSLLESGIGGGIRGGLPSS